MDATQKEVVDHFDKLYALDRAQSYDNWPGYCRGLCKCYDLTNYRMAPSEIDKKMYVACPLL